MPGARMRIRVGRGPLKLMFRSPIILRRKTWPPFIDEELANNWELRREDGTWTLRPCVAPMGYGDPREPASHTSPEPYATLAEAEEWAENVLPSPHMIHFHGGMDSWRYGPTPG